jgi:lysozyme family protein
MQTQAFEKAVDHAMLYEVGGFWKLTPDVEAGLIDTPEQRKAVGYTIDPTDRGGETKFGVAKNANPDLDITNLTWAQAKDVYYGRYWVPGKCEEMPARVAVLHFDGCVNHGVGRAAKFLQRALGVEDDGAIGNGTLSALAAQDEISVCNAICDQRAKFYDAIIAHDPSQSKYRKGWMRRIEEMRVFTTDPNGIF